MIRWRNSQHVQSGLQRKTSMLYQALVNIVVGLVWTVPSHCTFYHQPQAPRLFADGSFINPLSKDEAAERDGDRNRQRSYTGTQVGGGGSNVHYYPDQLLIALIIQIHLSYVVSLFLCFLYFFIEFSYQRKKITFLITFVSIFLFYIYLSPVGMIRPQWSVFRLVPILQLLVFLYLFHLI